MIKYLLLVLLPLSLYASKILSYNIYERSDRADVMITFDTPYYGTIKQSISQNKIIIKLENAQIESSKLKKVNSNFLHALTITPLQSQTQIVASIAPSVRLIASKTSDAYGLRLRFTNKIATNRAKNGNEDQNDLSALPTKKSEIVSTSYYIVVGVMLIGTVILFMLKKKIDPAQAQKPKSSWLFNASTQTPDDAKMVTIRFQKSINDTNSVVMLDFGNESYLVLMGNTNILLDKFKDNIPGTQQEFETILQDRNEELEDFLGSASQHTTQTYKEPLQAYKERAASLIYGDEGL